MQNKKITTIKVYKKKSTSVCLLIDFFFMVNDKVELLHEINHVLPYLAAIAPVHTFFVNFSSTLEKMVSGGNSPF